MDESRLVGWKYDCADPPSSRRGVVGHSGMERERGSGPRDGWLILLLATRVIRAGKEPMNTPPFRASSMDTEIRRMKLGKFWDEASLLFQTRSSKMLLRRRST